MGTRHARAVHAAALALVACLLAGGATPAGCTGGGPGGPARFPAPALAALEGVLEGASGADVPAHYAPRLPAPSGGAAAAGGDEEEGDGLHHLLGAAGGEEEWWGAALGNVTAAHEEQEEAGGAPGHRRALMKSKKKKSSSSSSSSNVYKFAAPTPALKKRIVAITTVFENGNTKLHYGYCSDLHDGRRALGAGGAGMPSLLLWGGRRQGGRAVSAPPHPHTPRRAAGVTRLGALAFAPARATASTWLG